MNPEINNFLKAGQKFRSSQLKKGKILLIEPDVNLRKAVTHLVESVNASLICCSGIREAETFLEVNPKCVILNWNEDIKEPAECFLKRIDKEYPCAISVMVSKNREMMNSIQNDIPRLTVIVKGEGLEEMLLNLFPEWSMKQNVCNH